MSGFSNQPKILHGAFVEFGLSLPPLVVVFQFNPEQLTRNHAVTFSAPNQAPLSTSASTQPGQAATADPGPSLRDWHCRRELSDIQKHQRARRQEETINFEIRLDATDKMNEGDAITAAFGVGPQLATLELMTYPKSDSLLGGLADALLSLGSDDGFSFTGNENPPLVLFIWGIKRVLPVNINSMRVTETEFSTLLDPTRATIEVNLTVIEGDNAPYTYSKAAREVTSLLNLANIADLATVVVPG